MNAGPPEQGPGDFPPPTPPPDAPPPPPAPPSEPPPPPGPYAAYAAPPSRMAPAPRRGMGPLLPIILVVVIVVVAVVAYAGIGYAYAQGRESSARDTYNAVIAHANSYTDTVNAMSSLNSNAFSAANLQQAKASYADLVTKSQNVQGQIDADKAKLSDADSSLKQTSWLTVISKSSLDRWSTKIGHLQKALDS